MLRQIFTTIIAAVSMVFIGALVPCMAQTHVIDKLKDSLQHPVNPSAKLNLLLRLCEERASLPSDSLYKYAALSRQIAASISDKEKMQWAEYYLAITLQNKGLLDSCARVTERHLAKLTPTGRLWLEFTVLKATLFIRSNQYKDAIAQSYKVLQVAEELHDTLMQLAAKNVIGWACMEMNSYDEALRWFSRALGTGAYSTFYKYYGVVYSNMAAVYNSLNQYDSAAVYVERALICARKYENLSKLANALNIQADLYMLTGRNAMAEAPLNEALHIRQKIADPFYIVSDMYQLSLYYARNGKARAGIELSREGISIARQYNLKGKLPILYEALAESYKADGDLKEYGQTLEKLMLVKDSVYRINTAEALQGLQAKYEVTKKENIIIGQKLALVQKNYLIYGSLVLLMLAIVLGAVLFSNYRRKQRVKLQHLMEQEHAAAIAAIHEAEEAERKRIAADLHDNLGAYAASIASNIDHLPAASNNNGSAVALHELRTNSREMVSQLADTIWVLKRDTLLITDISDRIKTFIQRIAASHPEINLEVIEHITQDKLLSPVQAFHLFRMMQEAVNNAVKHSMGNEVIIYIESTKELFSVRIEDNGKGMNGVLHASHSGNGLYNMQARAEAGGWKIRWLDRVGEGTVVHIEPATTN